MRWIWPVWLAVVGCDNHIFGENAAHIPAPEGVGYDAVIEISQGHCNSCHNAASASSFGNLDLETDLCSAVVGVSAFAYDAVLVEPGDSQASVFWTKMADLGVHGGVMPPGASLDDASIELVRHWIDEGASCAGSGTDSLDTADTGSETVADGCNDGLDNDSDGWTDSEDPDCLKGDEEVGLGVTECNDGLDNDGDGQIDSEDDFCTEALGDVEADGCQNGVDDDDDGWTDADDPDCLKGAEEVGLGVTECNDGLDNDGDGHIDSDDDFCTDALGDVEADGCENGTDDDGDGWIDAEDPDCLKGDEELGFGTTECNDGDDNDGDLYIDAVDPDCMSADDGSES